MKTKEELIKLVVELSNKINNNIIWNQYEEQMTQYLKELIPKEGEKLNLIRLKRSDVSISFDDEQFKFKGKYPDWIPNKQFGGYDCDAEKIDNIISKYGPDIDCDYDQIAEATGYKYVYEYDGQYSYWK